MTEREGQQSGDGALRCVHNEPNHRPCPCGCGGCALANLDMNFIEGDVDAIIKHRVRKSPTELQDAGEIEAAFEALHPTYAVFGPYLLYLLWRQQRLSVELLHRLLLDVWRYSDFP